MYEKKLEDRLDIQGRFSEVCTNACLAKTTYTLHVQRLHRKNIAHKLIHYVRWDVCAHLVCIFMRHQLLKIGHLLSKLLLTWMRIMYLLIYQFITLLKCITLFTFKDDLMVSWIGIWLPKYNYTLYFSFPGPSCPLHSIGKAKTLKTLKSQLKDIVKRLRAKFIGAWSKELNYKVIFFFLLEKDVTKTTKNIYFQVQET